MSSTDAASSVPSRDDLASMYLDVLPYEPYPVQEEALLAWFATKQGVLVCAPTGTGKTLIAEAALFEALHTGQVAYYTTPLIALTEQKFQEVQEAAIRWGFKAEDVGLVTGNRKVNPDAKVLVVVAEILLNRLLHAEAHDFTNVSAVVMDEFHSFNDPERGIVWELSLAMLPKHIRLLLLSATVGNATDFMIWLQRSHGRRVDLVRSSDRKIPLRYHWVGDQLLSEQLELMARGDDESKLTPVLLFCFNREECWTVAEQLKGKALLGEGQQKQLAIEMKEHDWSQGIGPKLKTILLRGVGVHHAGLLPKYKRIVESLFQQKLLSVCVCTETLAAGMNLPARSTLLTTLLKGPPGKKTVIDASSAHQMFGRAGRPQFDTEGHVFALAHEDDVKIQRFEEKLKYIPEDTKDPLLIRKRKQMKKKAPKRRKNVQYWSEIQFQKLIEAPPGNLQSQGNMPWRLLAYLLSISPDVSLVRQTISRRLMDDKRIAKQIDRLTEMLLALEYAGFIKLSPESPKRDRLGDLIDPESASAADAEPLLDRIERLGEDGAFGFGASWDGEYVQDEQVDSGVDEVIDEEPEEFGAGLFEDEQSESGDGEPSAELAVASHHEQSASAEALASESVEPASMPEEDSPAPAPAPEQPRDRKPKPLSSSLEFLLKAQGIQIGGAATVVKAAQGAVKKGAVAGPRLIHPGVDDEPIAYVPERAEATDSLASLLSFKSVNPLYGVFLTRVLPFCDGAERIQALESILVFPGALSRALRIPRVDVLPPSRFTTEFLHPELLQRGVCTIPELGGAQRDDDEDRPNRGGFDSEEEWVRPLTFPEKLLRLFYSEHREVKDVQITDVWAVGELLHFRGDFNALVTTRKLAKQEGILFRHVLRFILLCDEFLEHIPVGSEWHAELLSISARITDACRAVDAYSTDLMIESAKAPDALIDG
jgi:superfamily II DNA/RNA helicase